MSLKLVQTFRTVISIKLEKLYLSLEMYKNNCHISKKKQIKTKKSATNFLRA